jgi:reactive chlorine resistance protein C
MNSSTNQSQQIAGDAISVTALAKKATYISYFALALTIGWIGLLKFTAAEAEGIAPFVAHSPFMSWTYSVMSHQTLSNTLGSVELVVAALIVGRFLNPKLSAIGGFLATGMFLTTLSFMLSTPGAISGVIFGVVPELSVPGQFILKDTVLLGVALQILTESIAAIQKKP